jgi:hypothetical protein
MEHWFDEKVKRGDYITIRDERELLKELQLSISERNMDGLEMVMKAAFFELKREPTPRRFTIARHLMLVVTSFEKYDTHLLEDYMKKYFELERIYNNGRK